MSLAVAELIRGEPLLASAYEAARRRIDDVAELAFDKLIAHLDDPKKHPMPAKAQCLERAMLRLVQKQPDRVRRQLVRDHKGRLTAAARRKRYGVLSEVSLARAAPVVDQIAAPLKKELAKAPLAERKRIAEKLAAFRPPPAEPERPRRAATPATRKRAPAARGTPRGAVPQLALALEQVVCKQKTIEMFEGSDEMKLAINGFTIDDLIAGRPRAVDIVDLGKFKKGDSRALDAVSSALPLPLFGGNGLPSDFAAILVAAEKDRFVRDDDGLDQVVEVVLFSFTAASQAVMVFGVIVGLLVGLTMATIWWLAMAAGILLGLGFVAAMVVRRRLGDDVFEPERVHVRVETVDDVFPSEVVALRNGLTEVGQRRGEYALTYRWQIV